MVGNVVASLGALIYSWHKLWSGILSSHMLNCDILASAYMSNGNCTCHCFLFHHIDMTLSGVICGRITELSAIVAMCLHSTTSVLVIVR